MMKVYVKESIWVCLLIGGEVLGEGSEIVKVLIWVVRKRGREGYYIGEVDDFNLGIFLVWGIVGYFFG